MDTAPTHGGHGTPDGHRHGRIADAAGSVGETVSEAVSDAVSDAVAAVKPRLRGWLHAGTFPLAVVAGIVLISVAPTTAGRVSATIYTVTAALLFGTSAVYHRGTWSPRTEVLLKRLDHSNIFLIIAGTYTPFAALLLPSGRARTLLLIVWLGALGGVLFRVFWVGAPRWLYTPVYIALGWVAVIYLPDFLRQGGVALLTLIIVGGLLYTVGGVVYGLKRPNPSPRWFGFHEVFHACTVAAFTVHYIAVSFAVYSHR
jgi:hemolysin III